MSYKKRTRTTFSNIIAGTSASSSSAPSAPPAPSKKKRKIQNTTETGERNSELSLFDIQATLEKILSQNDELNGKVNELLDRVARIEEDNAIDKEFINVLNFLT